MRYGFIGLGNMGQPMARCLCRTGFDLVVHDRAPDRARELESEGAEAVGSAADVARKADIVFTCLLYPRQVEAVYFAAGGLIEAAREDQVFCNMSTVDPATTKATHDRLAERGVAFLDCPISGGVPAATSGSLTIMAGGDRVAYERARPGLSAMGDNLFYMGGSGSGTMMKLVNQLLVAVGEALTAEAMVLGSKAGLDARTMYDVVKVSSGYSFAFERVMKEFVLKRNFAPNATVNLILKDLDCVLHTAGDLGVRTLLASTARQAFVEARGLGYGEHDLSSVVLPLEQLSGVVVAGNEAAGS